MTSLIYKQIKDSIDKAEHILLLTDERIDGDTIGSTLGMYHVLCEMGKRVSVFSPQPIVDTLKFLPGVEDIGRDSAIFQDDSIDLVIIFDCSDGGYIREHIPSMRRPVPLVVLDHHESNPRYGTINLIESDAASTADIAWRFVKAMKFSMNRLAAQCFLTGICTDTHIFLTSNTSVASLDAAHELSMYGARLQDIVRETMMNRSLSTLRLWGLAFERLHWNEEFQIMATAITEADIKLLGVEEMETKSLANFLNAMLEGEDAVLVMRETDDGAVKGSFRSHERDVCELASRFGGGGHTRAAGFKVDSARLVESSEAWNIVKQ
ncbi:MAG: DHH family phosphoesterase [Candidatus Uhrbacteria bacterium]|nr:DHH family phosphoesterase [Candidatus Uhrbacteria bacterium]